MFSPLLTLVFIILRFVVVTTVFDVETVHNFMSIAAAAAVG